MAESDPVFERRVEEALPQAQVQGQGKPSRLKQIVLMASVPVVLVAGAVAYYIANDHYVTTDNAYVQQDKVSVSAQVTGEIVEVAARENQQVKAGDLLFRIDPEPSRIAIAQANATIAAAQVNVAGLEAELGTSGADVGMAVENVKFAQQEYNREAELMKRGFSTKARMEQVEHNVAAAKSSLASMQAKAREARAALATGPVAPGVNPAVLAGLAQKRKAELDLSRTTVHAPVSGTVTQADRLQLGQMMTAGLPALTIMVSDRSWVEANFKETELAGMRVGQPATLTFDAYPGLELQGHVASIGAGTGSEFSVLPAQNANGNWVKVTQRVPVRIAIDGKPNRQLIAGLSTHVSIDTSK
jgi:membrane fusion protein (multidrug efflux system)